MEEIDIIELLKRVKEGKAPKKIEINGNEYNYCPTEYNIQFLYQNNDYCSLVEKINFDTKIKILDKPIIEEFEVTDTALLPHQFRDKINEIIKWINKNV